MYFQVSERLKQHECDVLEKGYHDCVGVGTVCSAKGDIESGSQDVDAPQRPCSNHAGNARGKELLLNAIADEVLTLQERALLEVTQSHTTRALRLAHKTKML